ncbi:MAG: hypothetical protein ABL871_10630 [Terricaulis sp.]
MKKALYALLAFAAVFASTEASANPTIRTWAPGTSAIYIYMANPTDRSYSCTVSYSWAYDSWGTPYSGTETFAVTFQPNQGEREVSRMSGSFVNLHVTSGPSVQCN